MQQIRSVDVMSVAKVFGILYGGLALIFIPFFLLAGLGTMFTGQKEAALGGVVIMILAVFIPVIYGAMAFVMGAFMAWIYNVIAKRFGGIKIELQPVTPVSNIGVI